MPDASFPSSLPIWLIVPLVAGIVFATRALGPVLMAKAAFSPRVTRFLDGLAISVIVAMVATALAKAGPREAVAVALAATVMLTTRSVFWAMIAGVALAAGWSHFLPG
ncbi:AzlD domain-containing protein [Hwanghaeella grinnelliae]|uniref:AzlD domain-containing protein n=1 Tax=Hwanghaeella grinnelliae TaxID=2500179 RepID=A0A3S2Z750_9PROT|nr:AzlD domain-containing protein [Hwanghaeella grinnelliae]RVU34828.1 AzlD domain-containing protein [Hwanghaeella grinnelliae]